ncbi:ligase-associated DNA damage response endonuclease PdeM [Polymorphobacter sp.]|uniref:ligase-associated DNA damage response endonuclease PdeM n=1 Tax=Polymorphobacter sp. TaxID=1909290 RepID=UPI003F6FF473
MPLLFSGETLQPLPCGALFWPARGTLLVADLHLEKASYFAARGWPLPPWDSDATLIRLQAALDRTGARTVIALGDSFHDSAGPARLPASAQLRLAQIARRADIQWITGNHDARRGDDLPGTMHNEIMLGPLVLRHEAEPGDARPELSGHFHPKLTVRMKGRAIRRRCFALGATKLVLPAYGSLAGGLDINSPAFAAAIPGPLVALVCEGERLLRFPVTACAA